MRSVAVLYIRRFNKYLLFNIEHFLSLCPPVFHAWWLLFNMDTLIIFRLPSDYFAVPFTCILFFRTWYRLMLPLLLLPIPLLGMSLLFVFLRYVGEKQCWKIQYFSTFFGTFSFKKLLSTPTTLSVLFYCFVFYFIYSQSFYLESAERKLLIKYF